MWCGSPSPGGPTSGRHGRQRHQSRRRPQLGLVAHDKTSSSPGGSYVARTIVPRCASAARLTNVASPRRASTTPPPTPRSSACSATTLRQRRLRDRLQAPDAHCLSAGTAPLADPPAVAIETDDTHIRQHRRCRRRSAARHRRRQHGAYQHFYGQVPTSTLQPGSWSLQLF